MSKFAQWFRETTPYINTHRGKTFVVSLCGAALEHTNLINIVHDLALLKTLGVKLAIVHGARPQLDAVLPAPAHASALRITTEADLAPLRQTMGELRAQLEARFAASLPGSPLHNTHINLIGGNFVIAQPVGIVDGIDYQFTGRVRSIRTESLQAQLDLGTVVVLSPVGYSRSGQLYNIAAEDLAAEGAIALSADKLITFAADPYICSGNGTPLPELTPNELDDLLDELPESHGDRRRLQAMLKACRHSIPRCQQVSYQDDGALLTELFTADGQGSQLAQAPYRNVRTATAADLPQIIALIRPLEQQGMLVRRSRVTLEREINQFLVAEVDNQIIGCCALHEHSDSLAQDPDKEQSTLMELACFATRTPSTATNLAEPLRSSEELTDASDGRNGKSARDRTASKDGKAPVRASIGEQLLAAAERTCLQRGVQQLFVLTTLTQDWFLEHGFTALDIAQLPASKRAEYDHKRKSQAYVKRIGTRGSRTQSG